MLIMKTKKHILWLSVLLLFTGGLCSCTDWLDEQPKDRQSEAQQFSSKEGFNSAVNGIYNRMGGDALYGKRLSYEMIELLGQTYSVNQTLQDNFYKYQRALCNWNYNDETVTNVLSSIWNEAYSTIMNINVILKNLEEDSAERHVLPLNECKMLKGEMLACRAMIHLDLLRLFGPIYSKNPQGRGIPYSESHKVDILPILTAEEVLQKHILRDLLEAEELLLASDPVVTEGPRAEYDAINMDNSMRYRQLRLNYYAAVLLTARAYLWGGDNANALAEAKKLTDDPNVRKFFPKVSESSVQNQYAPDYMFSTECLFGFYNKNRGLIYDYTFGGDNTYQKLLIPRKGYIDGILFANPDANDYRYRCQYQYAPTLIEGENSMALIKFKRIADEGRDDVEKEEEKDENLLLMVQKFYGTFCSIMKLSEAYYIAAEACGTPESEVYNLADGWKYLNAVRSSRGLGQYPDNTDAYWLEKFLSKDIVREFAGEGQKFFYFKRRNKGFDNDYNGQKEIRVMTDPGFPPFFPPTYDETDAATDAEKEARFVIPLPKSELDNR